jgi:hypothetical protein
MEEFILNDDKSKIISAIGDASYGQGVIDAIDKLGLKGKLGNFGKALGLADAFGSATLTAITLNEVAFSYLVAQDFYGDQIETLSKSNLAKLENDLNFLDALLATKQKLQNNLKNSSPGNAKEIQSLIADLGNHIQTNEQKEKGAVARQNEIENMKNNITRFDFEGYHDGMQRYLSNTYLNKKSDMYNRELGISYQSEMNSISELNQITITNKLYSSAINSIGMVPTNFMSIVNNAATKWFNNYITSPRIDQNWNINDAYKYFTRSRENRLRYSNQDLKLRSYDI